MLQLVGVMTVPKENKLLVRNEIPNQNIPTLVRFYNKPFTTCQVSNHFFTTRQISKQNFHNMLDFNSNILKRVRFSYKKNNLKISF